MFRCLFVYDINNGSVIGIKGNIFVGYVGFLDM